jgi:hypothetical protein
MRAVGETYPRGMSKKFIYILAYTHSRAHIHSDGSRVSWLIHAMEKKVSHQYIFIDFFHNFSFTLISGSWVELTFLRQLAPLNDLVAKSFYDCCRMGAWLFRQQFQNSLEIFFIFFFLRSCTYRSLPFTVDFFFYVNLE